MSGIRWTTGIGIAVGGVSGAVAAWVGAPAAPPTRAVEPTVAAAEPRPVEAMPAATELPPPNEPPAAVPEPAPSSPPAHRASASPAPAGGNVTIPPLDVPTTTQALLKAQVLCDRKKSYDDCSRAARALEQGSAGPADAAQAKRFRRIALTHLVRACEVGDPHACFILAEKHRSGGELTASPVRAAALEQRGLELCRVRSAAECPPR